MQAIFADSMMVTGSSEVARNNGVIKVWDRQTRLKLEEAGKSSMPLEIIQRIAYDSHLKKSFALAAA